MTTAASHAIRSASPSPADEHELEAELGLPEPLPANERLLWRGGPVFATMVERVFHARTLSVYFGAILLVRAATVWAQGGSPLDGAVAALWLLPAALLALGNVVLLAWLTSRTTVYTITDRRVVMRVGIVLTVTFNLPYGRIESAAIQRGKGSTGDIALALGDADHIAYLHLWPHARPWRLRKTEPMLRSLADAPAVGRLLADAWCAARGMPLRGADATAPHRAEPAAVSTGVAAREPRGLAAAARHA